MRSLLPQVTPRYFGSEWSYAQIRGLEARTIVAFGAREHTIICTYLSFRVVACLLVMQGVDQPTSHVHLNVTGVGADGSYLVSNFAKGGEGERVSYKKFIRCVCVCGAPINQPTNRCKEASTSTNIDPARSTRTHRSAEDEDEDHFAPGPTPAPPAPQPSAAASTTVGGVAPLSGPPPAIDRGGSDGSGGGEPIQQI